MKTNTSCISCQETEHRAASCLLTPCTALTHTRQDASCLPVNCFLPKGGRCSSWVQGHVLTHRLLLSYKAYPALSQVVLGLFSAQQPRLCAGRVTGAPGEEH